MRFLYTLLLYAFTPLVLLRLCWLSLRNRDYLRHWPQRFGFVAEMQQAQTVWIHAVSVGEVQAAVPLIHELKDKCPDIVLVLTTTTPTGADHAERLLKGQVTHLFAPYDLPLSLALFLKRIKPGLAIFMETELWPNTFHQCRLRGIPVAVINARLSASSAKGYARFSSLCYEMLQNVDLIAAQHQADADRFASLGANPDRLHVTGSIKFDSRLPLGVREQGQALRHMLGVNRTIWIAASTHEGEEEQVLQAHTALLEKRPDALLVLVPRHPERFSQVADLCVRQGLQITRRTEAVDCSRQSQVFLLDTMGELMLFYAAVDVAFIGGSLIPRGGHNMLEAACLGVPVIVGPHTFNFAVICQQMLQRKAAFEVEDAQQLASLLQKLFSNAELRDMTGGNGLQMVEDNKGAVNKVSHLLDALIPEPPS